MSRVSGDKFERYISMLPVPWEKLVAMGVNHLADELEADEVRLKTAANGVSIVIITDDENKQEAENFWFEYVQPALEGD